MLPSPADRPLLEIVASDLQFLRDEWDNDLDDHSLRRSSPVLRRLIVENDLHRAWRAAGFDGQASVTASTLDEILRVIPAHRIEFASAGGASFKGAEVRGALLLRFVIEQDKLKAISQGPPPERKFTLLEFAEAPCVIVKGKIIRRRQIVKYVSNKLGGAHLDQSRGSRKEDATYRLLDTVGPTIKLLDKQAIYFELLAAGQAIARAQDLLRLSARIIEILGPPASA